MRLNAVRGWALLPMITATVTMLGCGPALASASDVRSNLYAVNADGSDLQQLTSFGQSDTRVTQPRMTPDGSGILFTRVDGDGYGMRTLAVVNADGSELRGLTPTEIEGTHSQLRPTAP